MTCQKEYAFFLQILQKAGIGSREFSLPPAEDTDIELDAGLRRQLGVEPSVFAGCRPFLRYLETGTLYHVADRFYLHYLFLVLPGDSRCLSVGPYLSLRPSQKQIFETAEQWDLRPAQTHLLEEFYATLPLVADNSPFYSMVYCLYEVLHGSEARVRQISLEDELAAVGRPEAPAGTGDLKALMQRLENRYRFEDELMEAVSHANRSKLRQLLQGNSLNMAVEPRLADPVRNLKNYYIIMNTILRKAAQRGGVHPLYLDDLSRTFAARIEQLPTTAAGNRLILEMGDQYCLLVQQHSLTDHSRPVQYAMLYVRQHLAEPLNLHTVAAAVGVNASYFSARFKKETGQTLTEYILQERMRLAVNLLPTTRLQVQTIAQYCGFLDVNYFSRLFRQSVGVSPTEYRRQGRSLQM